MTTHYCNLDDIKVSIITPTFNSSDYVLTTYDSIANQTHKNWEWLVTDDCSTDETIEILESIALKDGRVKIFKNDINSGAAVTRNNSLRNAVGQYIAFIDSDDIWDKDKLSAQLSFMVRENLVFTFTAYELIDERGVRLNKVVDLQGMGRKFNYENMLKKQATLGCSTVILKKSSFGVIEMPLLRTGQDYALWLKLLKEGVQASLFNKVLTQYRILPNSISRNKIKKARRQWEIYRKVESLTLVKSSICFMFYAWRATFRR